MNSPKSFGLTTSFYFAVCTAVLVTCASAQVRPKGGKGPQATRVHVDTSPNFRNEVEGTIWEFKIYPKDDGTIADDPDAQEKEKKGDEEDDDGRDIDKDANDDNESNVGGPIRRRLARAQQGGDPPNEHDGVTIDDDGTIRGKLRINGNAVYDGTVRRAAEDEHRIADFVSEKIPNGTKCEIRFDDHDRLHGRAVFEINNRQEGGVYKGYYRDAHNKRFKFEMRRGED